jgi:hypothetical protein
MDIVIVKGHLTNEGLKVISDIKSGMNSGRFSSSNLYMVILVIMMIILVTANNFLLMFVG